MRVIATGLRVAAVISAVLLWFSYDKLTGTQVMWCWGLIAGAIGWYALSCWWFPFGFCACCKGKGSHYREDGKVFRTCKRFCFRIVGCGGVGRKLRWGRRGYNFVRKVTTGTTGKETT